MQDILIHFAIRENATDIAVGIAAEDPAGSEANGEEQDAGFGDDESGEHEESKGVDLLL